MRVTTIGFWVICQLMMLSSSVYADDECDTDQCSEQCNPAYYADLDTTLTATDGGITFKVHYLADTGNNCNPESDPDRWCKKQDDNDHDQDEFPDHLAEWVLVALLQSYSRYSDLDFLPPYQCNPDTCSIPEYSQFNTLIYDRDHYTYDKKYFSGDELGPSRCNSQSRQACIVINAPAYYVCTSLKPNERILRVVQHEMFHSINGHYRWEGNKQWVGEGTAACMEDRLFESLDQEVDFGFYSRVESDEGPLYLPQTRLFDYNKGGCLFFSYCCEQFGYKPLDQLENGYDFILQFFEEVEASGDDIPPEEEILDFVIQDRTDGEMTLQDAWLNYAICNYTKDYIDKNDVLSSPELAAYYYVDEHDSGATAYDPVATTPMSLSDYDPSVVLGDYAIRYFEVDNINVPDCTAVGFVGYSLITGTKIVPNAAEVGWAVVVIDPNDELIAISKGYGTEYSQTFLSTSDHTVGKICGIVATLDSEAECFCRFGSGALTLEIASPTQVVPAYPGSASDPSRFLVYVRVNGPSTLKPNSVEDVSVLGLQKEEFSVQVGSETADILAADYMGETYWLEVQAPEQSGGDGKYDLTVSLCGSTSVTNNQAVEYGEYTVNHMVVLDQSKSMDEPTGGEFSKLDAAKNAATLYIDGAGEDDRIGVVTFWGNNIVCDNDAILRADLSDRNDAARWIINFGILSLSTDTTNRYTSIGDGLVEAQCEIERVAVGDSNKRRIILLSDGNENEGRFWYADSPCISGDDCGFSRSSPAMEMFRDKDTVINAISFGSDADQSLMEDIADFTDGIHLHVKVEDITSSSSFQMQNDSEDLTLPNRLAQAYIDILSQNRDAEQVFFDFDSVDPGITEIVIPVTESNLTEATFIFNVDYRTANPTVELLDPHGTAITASDAFIATHDTNVVFHLNDSPIVGDWTARLNVTVACQYVAALLAKSPHGAKLTVGVSPIKNGGVSGWLRPSFEEGVPVRIVALLTDRDGPILNADVQTKIEKPDGSIACGVSSLNDKARDGDRFADDGAYAALYTDTSQGSREGVDNDGDQGQPGTPGTYMVTITASGTTNSGDAFTRIYSTGFHVFDGLNDADGDLLPDTWEVHYHTDPNFPSGPNHDPDRDGLTPREEFTQGTNPLNPDSDQDGELDGSEVDLGRCPTDPSDSDLSCPLDVGIVLTNPEMPSESSPTDENLLYFPWRSSYAEMHILRAVDNPLTMTPYAVVTPTPVDPRPTNYTDNALETGRTYFYQFFAVGHDGGVTRPSMVVSRTMAFPDCNNNGSDDAKDITSGTSFDCNFNGKPDECDIDSGASQDVNGNDIPDECEVKNLTQNTWHPTIPHAITAANDFDELLADVARFAADTIIDFAGKALTLTSRRQIVQLSGSSMILADDAILQAAPNRDITLNGNLFVNTGDQANVISNSFFVNETGGLRADANSVVNVVLHENAHIHGSIIIEPLATVSFSGMLINRGNILANGGLLDAPIISNYNDLNLVAGQVQANTIVNQAPSGIMEGYGEILANVANSSEAIFTSDTQVVGDYINDGITTINSGVLTVSNTLTNNGTIIGEVVESLEGLAPNSETNSGLTILGNYVDSSDASLKIPDVTSKVRIGGDFNCAVNNHTNYHMSQATLQAIGTGAVGQSFEVMSKDIGPVVIGLDRTLPGHFPLDTLRIGPTPTTVDLVDNHDNDGQAQSTAEAIYVNKLIIDAGATLNTNGLIIYYVSLSNNGTVTDISDLLPIQNFTADLNGDGCVNLADFVRFSQMWEDTDCIGPDWCNGADLSQDGFVGLVDLDVFTSQWLQGCSAN